MSSKQLAKQKKLLKKLRAKGVSESCLDALEDLLNGKPGKMKALNPDMLILLKNEDLLACLLVQIMGMESDDSAEEGIVFDPEPDCPIIIPGSLDKIDTNLYEKSVIELNRDVIHTSQQANVMIVMGVILIAPNGNYFRKSYRDIYGRKKKVTLKDKQKALARRYNVKDLQMMRKKPAECMAIAKAYVKEIREP